MSGSDRKPLSSPEDQLQLAIILQSSLQDGIEALKKAKTTEAAHLFRGIVTAALGSKTPLSAYLIETGLDRLLATLELLIQNKDLAQVTLIFDFIKGIAGQLDRSLDNIREILFKFAKLALMQVENAESLARADNFYDSVINLNGALSSQNKNLYDFFINNFSIINRHLKEDSYYLAYLLIGNLITTIQKTVSPKDQGELILSDLAPSFLESHDLRTYHSDITIAQMIEAMDAHKLILEKLCDQAYLKPSALELFLSSLQGLLLHLVYVGFRANVIIDLPKDSTALELRAKLKKLSAYAKMVRRVHELLPFDAPVLENTATYLSDRANHLNNLSLESAQSTLTQLWPEYLGAVEQDQVEAAAASVKLIKLVLDKMSFGEKAQAKLELRTRFKDFKEVSKFSEASLTKRITQLSLDRVKLLEEHLEFVMGHLLADPALNLSDDEVGVVKHVLNLVFLSKLYLEADLKAKDEPARAIQLWTVLLSFNDLVDQNSLNTKIASAHKRIRVLAEEAQRLVQAAAKPKAIVPPRAKTPEPGVLTASSAPLQEHAPKPKILKGKDLALKKKAEKAAKGKPAKAKVEEPQVVSLVATQVPVEPKEELPEQLLKPKRTIAIPAFVKDSMLKLKASSAQGAKATYIGGGYVRDCLREQQGLHRNYHKPDWDVCTGLTDGEIQQIFPQARQIDMGENAHGQKRYLHELVLEDGSKLTLYSSKTLRDHEDLEAGREAHASTLDFTINSYLASEEGVVEDPLKVLSHLNEPCLYTINKNPETAFQEDPVRMFRAIYLTNALFMHPNPRLDEAMINSQRELKNFLLGPKGDFNCGKINSQMHKHLFSEPPYNIFNFEGLFLTQIIPTLFPELARAREGDIAWLKGEITAGQSLNIIYAEIAMLSAKIRGCSLEEVRDSTPQQLYTPNPLIAKNFATLNATLSPKVTAAIFQQAYLNWSQHFLQQVHTKFFHHPSPQVLAPNRSNQAKHGGKSSGVKPNAR